MKISKAINKAAVLEHNMSDFKTVFVIFQTTDFEEEDPIITNEDYRQLLIIEPKLKEIASLLNAHPVATVVRKLWPHISKKLEFRTNDYEPIENFYHFCMQSNIEIKEFSQLDDVIMKYTTY
jgi:hypothetical protein